PRVHERWAHLRFSVIGQLLAAPPPKGELRAQIEALAGRQWRHPITGEPARFGFSTIERWFYRALKERSDPVGVLRRKLRTDAGQQPAMSEAVRQAVLAQYAAHKSWSVQLHHDNLVALAETRPELKPVPSYPTLRRFMRPMASTSGGASHHARPTAPIAPRTSSPIARSAATRPSTLAACGIGTVIMDRRRCSPGAASGRRRSCSACSMIAHASPVICSGIWPRPPRSSPTA